MPKGGKREGAGRPSRWGTGKIKTIRVPEAIADQVMELAIALNEGKKVHIVTSTSKLPSYEKIIESKVLDLSRVPLSQVSGEIAVKLTDLVRSGYEIRPKKVSDLVKARLGRLF